MQPVSSQPRILVFLRFNILTFTYSQLSKFLLICNINTYLNITYDLNNQEGRITVEIKDFILIRNQRLIDMFPI